MGASTPPSSRLPWGAEHLRRWALADGASVLASAKIYRFDATLDGRSIQVVGIGAVFTQPPHRGRGHARHLVERLLEREIADGADLALLFSEIGPEYYARLGFTTIPTTDLTLLVTESIAAWRAGDARSRRRRSRSRRHRGDGPCPRAPYRFHLDRDRDLVHYAIAKKRLMAGLGPSGARQVQFFIAEEGASAVASVVIVRSEREGGVEWMLEEAGDRDPTGARVGAILQVLIARDPAERRPTIRGWLPDGFCPPQVRIIGRQPSAEVMMIRPLTSRTAHRQRRSRRRTFCTGMQIFSEEPD